MVRKYKVRSVFGKWHIMRNGKSLGPPHIYATKEEAETAITVSFGEKSRKKKPASTKKPMARLRTNGSVDRRTLPKEERIKPETGQSRIPFQLEWERMNKDHQTIILAMTGGDMSIADIHTKVGIKKLYIRNALRDLVPGGWVTRVGRGTYKLAKAGRDKLRRLKRKCKGKLTSTPKHRKKRSVGRPKKTAVPKKRALKPKPRNKKVKKTKSKRTKFETVTIGDSQIEGREEGEQETAFERSYEQIQKVDNDHGLFQTDD